MEGQWMFIAGVFGAVTVATLAMGWAQWLEHQRRTKALDVIKAAIERGQEPPAIVYEELSKAGARKPPWGEIVVFTALAIGFWIAFATADGGGRTRYLIVAATFTATAVGLLALTLLRPGDGKRSNEST